MAAVQPRHALDRVEEDGGEIGKTTLSKLAPTWRLSFDDGEHDAGVPTTRELQAEDKNGNASRREEDMGPPSRRRAMGGLAAEEIYGGLLREHQP